MRIVLYVALTAIVLGACSRPPAETQIRQRIAAMQKAAESRDAGGVLDGIAADFAGEGGSVDRAGLSRIVKLQFLQKNAIGVSLGSLDIAVDGDRATVKFPMTVSDGTLRWLPSGSESYDVVSGWRREGGNWVCYNATWTEKR